MSMCPHCEGTGIAPDRITLECIGCQRKVAVTFTGTSDLMAKCERVQCAECKKREAAEPC